MSGKRFRLFGQSEMDRVTARLEPDAATGCLSWSGPVNNKGYGRIMTAGVRSLVHRVAYEAEARVMPVDIRAPAVNGPLNLSTDPGGDNA